MATLSLFELTKKWLKAIKSGSAILPPAANNGPYTADAPADTDAAFDRMSACLGGIVGRYVVTSDSSGGNPKFIYGDASNDVVSPTAGDMWFDGTNLKIYTGAVWRTVTLDP